MNREYPILEFDPDPRAIIGPPSSDGLDIPERCVVCFFQEVIDALHERGEARRLVELRSEMGPRPVYEIVRGGERLALIHPGVGAPLAAAFLDEMIGLGCQRFIACGGAGVLDPAIAMGHLVILTSAVRDEGTSYYYLPPGREVTPSREGVAAIETALQKEDVSYLLAKTWTTDAFYRETPAKVRRRREEGCVTVEMEAAAFFAVAAFRGVTFAQILYGGDDVSGVAWDHRDWTTAPVRERLLWLAAEACLLL